jgi:autotransporter-associated beta strand protein
MGEAQRWSFQYCWEDESLPRLDPDAVVDFPDYIDGTGRLSRVDFDSDGIPIRSIVFHQPGYFLTHDYAHRSIRLSDHVQAWNTVDSNIVDVNMWLTADTHFFDANGSATLAVIGDLSGGGGLFKRGTGTLLLSGDNRSYQGRIGVHEGVLKLGGSDALSSAATVFIEGGTLDLNGFDVTLTNLQNIQSDIVLGSGNLTLEGGITDINGTVSGSGGLNLMRNAFVHFRGSQTYSGPTRVNSGTLQIDGTSPRSPVSVESGAHLSGRGQVGVLTVSGSVLPGDPAQTGASNGVLRSADVTFLAGSTFAARLDGPNPGGPNGHDQLDVAGRVNLSGSPTLNVSLGFASRAGDTFNIIYSTGGITGTFAGLPDNTSFGIGGKPFRIHYTSNSVVLEHLPQFLPPVHYRVDRNGARSLAVADFNGDGMPDLAAGNYYDGTVSVLLGNGDGTFQDQRTFFVGYYISSLATGDFNGDGNQDLAGGVETGHTLYVLLGNGDGSFQDAVRYTVGEVPFSVVVGDLNGDGAQDLVVANRAYGVSILYGTGDGTFQEGVILDFPLYPPRYVSGAVTLVDLNRDGQLDLVLGNWTGYSVTVIVLANDGNDEAGYARFRHSADDDYPIADVTSLAVADVDGDGRLDLVAASALGAEVGVLKGNGDGTFQRPWKLSRVGNLRVESAMVLAVADFDGDGKLDVAATGYGDNRGIVLLYGKGDGFFQPPAYYDIGGEGAWSVAADDFNGDGAPDLAAVLGSNRAAVLLNRTDRGGSPPPPAGSSTPRAPVVHTIPGAGLFVLAEEGVRETGSACSPVSSTGAEVPLSGSGVLPAVDVRYVDRLFAVVSQEDRRSAVPGLRPLAFMALVDRLLWEPAAVRFGTEWRLV